MDGKAEMCCILYINGIYEMGAMDGIDSVHGINDIHGT